MNKKTAIIIGIFLLMIIVGGVAVQHSLNSYLK